MLFQSKSRRLKTIHVVSTTRILHRRPAVKIARRVDQADDSRCTFPNASGFLKSPPAWHCTPINRGMLAEQRILSFRMIE